MNFWIIHAQEPLPEASKIATRRLWRSNTLAEMLAARGHQVVRWRSSYSHYEKRYLVDGPLNVRFENYKFQFLVGPSYRCHVGHARVRHHREIANQFAAIAAKSDHRPDVIHVCNVPIELCRAAVDFGVKHGVPVVIDVRDLWPDLFLDLVPKALSLFRPFVKLCLLSHYRNAAYAMQRATAITGITRPFVDWGLRLGNRRATEVDQVFHMSYPDLRGSATYGRSDQDVATKLNLMADDIVCCYFGAVGYQSDFETLIRAARLVEGKSKLKFVICGHGPKLSSLRSKAKGLANMIFPGWLEAKEVNALMGIATVGLIPFKEKDNYVLNMPNKFSEYLSGGLILACGLRGEMARLIDQHRCGFVYPTGDAVALARKLDELTRLSSVEVDVMRENARLLFQSQFNYKIVYRRLCDYLEQLPARIVNE